MNDLGKGLTLGQLPHHGSLYVVEFKAGRNDLFYMTSSNVNGDSNPSPPLKRGDLVIVEADRGKDLGKIANDSISPQQIQALQAQQAEMAAIAAQQDLSALNMGMGMNNGGVASGAPTRTPKEIHPKRIFRLAQPSEVALLVSKNQDEMKAMVVCQSKVRQKKLPMEVVDAEYQWDRRKLTFYFIAERRIDFRELVRDLFKIYKTRIWMYAVNP
ncbi:MAG: PSP1 C-terminal conserved region-domain-containing protein, partial [Podila humilis]